MTDPGRVVLAVHGGAGTIPPSEGGSDGEAGYRAGLTGALRAGHAVLARGGGVLDHDGTRASTPHAYGTVGAVALDAAGDLAAATSTGGITNERPGRVGDSPPVGAGTYADTAAISCTGTGEDSMRGVVAYDVAARMRHAGATRPRAAEATIRDALDARGGRGGLIAPDRSGRVALRFNTRPLPRRDPGGRASRRGDPRRRLIPDPPDRSGSGVGEPARRPGDGEIPIAKRAIGLRMTRVRSDRPPPSPRARRRDPETPRLPAARSGPVRLRIPPPPEIFAAAWN